MAAQDLLWKIILTIFFGDDPMLLTSLLQGTSHIKYHHSCDYKYTDQGYASSVS